MRQNGNQPVISLRGEIFILRMNLEQRNQLRHQKKKPGFPKEKGVKERKIRRWLKPIHSNRYLYMSVCLCGYMHACMHSCLVVSNYLRPYRLQPVRLSGPWEFSRGPPQPRYHNCISCASCIGGGFFTTEPPGEHTHTHTHTYCVNFKFSLYYFLFASTEFHFCNFYRSRANLLSNQEFNLCPKSHCLATHSLMTFYVIQGIKDSRGMSMNSL